MLKEEFPWEMDMGKVHGELQAKELHQECGLIKKFSKNSAIITTPSKSSELDRSVTEDFHILHISRLSFYFRSPVSIPVLHIGHGDGSMMWIWMVVPQTHVHILIVRAVNMTLFGKKK